MIETITTSNCRLVTILSKKIPLSNCVQSDLNGIDLELEKVKELSLGLTLARLWVTRHRKDSEIKVVINKSPAWMSWGPHEKTLRRMPSIASH